MSENGSMTTIGFDIGGTNMRAAAIDPRGNIVESHSIASPQTEEGMQQGIVSLVDELSKKHDIAAVGLAVAGFLDPECETVRFAPHLPWRDRPVRRELEELLGMPVVLEHDANSAAWGEYRFGGARGNDNWVLFALGTGIGATLLNDGAIYRGAFGTAPEFGHLTVVPNGRACACGKSGCLERYCSGTALVDTAREMLAELPGKTYSPLAALAARGELKGKHITQFARENDELSLAVLAEFSRWLGIALSMVADVLDPGLILIGGGVSRDADLYLPTAVEHMASSIVGAGYRPLATVSCAELGSDAGMIGVADLARQRVSRVVQ
ncbi:Glucose kinase [Corynebacterium kutscheri]|uniref:Glucokinase n=1 Tax=Corynebacterium kutscheri TaxID=35755 RepID=A0A0F6R086_9CORY|nr:ROK family glucokinase [Corynebacterium kutscheri]AKE41582.1 ROK family protein, putative glucokinase [Corynebacterium kutscheri]VEH08861.1 Glucose kinase [Corynebacterium kutscheri]VEH09906.1 Glucose kinase [Corynebacterium kutscheri]VEH79990.1 Glucose kinase [Corynebacterium kutscheri]